MAALTEQLATTLKYICSCNLTQDHITNGRWVCDPRDPTTVLFRADVTGTGSLDSSTIANDVSQWAEQTNSVHLGTETLPVQGAMQCEDENCITSSVSPAGPSNLWIIGVVAGILVLLIIIAVAAVILLWWKNSRMKSFRLVWQLQCLSCVWSIHYLLDTLQSEFPCRLWNVKILCKHRFVKLMVKGKFEDGLSTY